MLNQLIVIVETSKASMGHVWLPRKLFGSIRSRTVSQNRPQLLVTIFLFT